MRGGRDAIRGETRQEADEPAHALDVERWLPPAEASTPGQLGRRQGGAVVCKVADQPELVAGVPRHRDRQIALREETDRADDGRREDRSVGRLVVEADVPRDHRQVEGPAGLGDPVDRPLELPGSVVRLGGAEVQAVGDPDRGRARARDVEGALQDRRGPGQVRIERAEARGPGPSIASARARRVPFNRSRAASPAPGPTSVFVPFMWSYRCQIGLRSRAFAEPRSSSRTDAVTGSAASGSRSVGSGRGADAMDRVARRLVGERSAGDLADDLARRAASDERAVGDRPIAAASSS